MVEGRRISQDDFVELARVAAPDLGPVIDEHLRDNDGELLIHLLLPDFLRYAVTRYRAGDTAGSDAVLGLVERGLVEGDDHVRNAVSLSFVEGVGAGSGETQEFVASWPEALLAEREAQLNWRPE
jgi:hypothetical protein